MVYALTMALLLAQAETTEASFEKFFESFREQRDGVRVLRASFVQKTVTEDEVITSRGIISYAHPKRLMFRYSDEPLVYAMDGNRIYEYDGEIEQLQIFELEDRPETGLMFLGFENNVDELQEAFNVHVSTPDDSKRTTVKLTPKDPDSEDVYFMSVTLHLREGDYLPVEIEIESDEESRVYITLEDMVVNGTLSEDDTQIFLPEGTDILENDTYIERVGPEGRRLPPLTQHKPNEDPR